MWLTESQAMSLILILRETLNIQDEQVIMGVGRRTRFGLDHDKRQGLLNEIMGQQTRSMDIIEDKPGKEAG